MKPKCPYFNKCGGCNTQNIEYSTQLENKKKTAQSVTRFEDVKIFSDEPFGYRNRMDFVFHKDGLGLREEGKWWKIVDIEECAIANNRINKLLTEVRGHFSHCDVFDLKKRQGTFRYCVIRATRENESISFVLNSGSSKIGEAIGLVRSFAKSSSVKNIIITYVPPQTDMSVSEEYFVVKGEETLTESFIGKQFKFNVQGFFQNNSIMAEKMQEYVSNLLETEDSAMTLLDLYGGVGTFGIMNAEKFKEVLTVEGFDKATELAKENVKINNMENVSAICMDGKQIKNLELKGGTIVITDPPRSGMHHKTISHLNALKVPKIVYVSCNPRQLAKELLQLNQYRVKSVGLFDLFPQTNHFEIVVELEKN